MAKIIHKIAFTCITILLLINTTAGRLRVLLSDADLEDVSKKRIEERYQAASATIFSGESTTTRMVSYIRDIEDKLRILVINSGFTDAPSGISVTSVAKQIREAFPKPVEGAVGGGDAVAGAGEGPEGVKTQKELVTEEVLAEHLRRNGFDFSAYDAAKILIDIQKITEGGDSKKDALLNKIGKYTQREKEILVLYDHASIVSERLKRFTEDKFLSAPFSIDDAKALKTAFAGLQGAKKNLGLDKKDPGLLKELRSIQRLKYQYDAYNALEAASGDAAAVDPEKAEAAKAAARDKLMTCYHGSCAEDALLHKILYDLSSKPKDSPKILRVEIYGPMDPCHQCQVKLEWLADKLAKQYQDADLRPRVEVCYFSKKGYPQSPCMVREPVEGEEGPLTFGLVRSELEKDQLMMYRYFSDPSPVKTSEVLPAAAAAASAEGSS